VIDDWRQLAVWTFRLLLAICAMLFVLVVVVIIRAVASFFRP